MSRINVIRIDSIFGSKFIYSDKCGGKKNPLSLYVLAFWSIETQSRNFFFHVDQRTESWMDKVIFISSKEIEINLKKFNSTRLNIQFITSGQRKRRVYIFKKFLIECWVFEETFSLCVSSLNIWKMFLNF